MSPGVAAKSLADLNLTAEEYDAICGHLRREPNNLELQIYSVMWSEHCSYKSSRVHLRRLPTRGDRVLLGPGENAGIVDIGDGLAAVFKIESHNHPSFIEPYQGAATGVGGIIRDIFTMGARPIAILDSLRFGPLEKPQNRSILKGVVSGIAGYGNCMGIPTTGGEIMFDDCYSFNPLVNVLCVGIARHGDIHYGKASGIGNPVIYVGARTGRDGIHGATMASAEFNEDAQAKRPNVQVGDPFMEKLLLEACLEAMKKGLVTGIQDMGAAGLTCSTCEMGARAGTGIELQIELVPLREEGMTPEEIMLSESQERMLLVTERGREQDVGAIFKKWGLESAVVGTVIADPVLRIRNGEAVLAEIPNRTLTDDAPRYTRPLTPPAGGGGGGAGGALPSPPLVDPGAALIKLLSAAPIASKRWVYEQYDHMVRTNTLVLPGSDATVLRVKGTGRAIALSVDGNGGYTAAQPMAGAMAAVAEAARNVACSGARPIAATNCLNFGNPEKPEIMGQFSDVIDGMAEACRTLGVPITGGNVSFYNETAGKGIHPTPVIGVLGLLEDATKVVDQWYKADGDVLYVCGAGPVSLGASEYLRTVHGLSAGVPAAVDLKAERALIDLCVDAAARGLVRSAHDCSDGGLAVALAESGFAPGGLRGVSVELAGSGSQNGEVALAAFGEGGARVVVSVAPGDAAAFESLAARIGCPARKAGIVGGNTLQLAWRGVRVVDVAMAELFEAWSGSLARQLQ